MKLFNRKAIMVPLIIVILLIAPSCTTDESNEILLATYEAPEMENKIFTEVNSLRTSKGQPKLIFDETVRGIAREHSVSMLKNGELSHQNFGKRSNYILDNNSAKKTAENVDYGYTSAKTVVQAWIESIHHSENLFGDFSHTGIGVVKGEDGKHYFTQIFYKK